MTVYYQSHVEEKNWLLEHLRNFEEVSIIRDHDGIEWRKYKETPCSSRKIHGKIHEKTWVLYRLEDQIDQIPQMKHKRNLWLK